MSEGQHGASQYQKSTSDDTTGSVTSIQVQSPEKVIPQNDATSSAIRSSSATAVTYGQDGNDSDSDDQETFHDAEDTGGLTSATFETATAASGGVDTFNTPGTPEEAQARAGSAKQRNGSQGTPPNPSVTQETISNVSPVPQKAPQSLDQAYDSSENGLNRSTSVKSVKRESTSFPAIKRERKKSEPQAAEWSHQQLTSHKAESDDEEEVEWQAMPAIDEYDVFDDDGRLVARGTKEDVEDDKNAYAMMGGAGKGYTRVLLDEDARSTTSLDEDTEFLFKKPQPTNDQDVDDEFQDDDEQRDVLSQLQATKDLLTEGQRIAYVGVVRLAIFKMLRAISTVEGTRGTKKDLAKCAESMEKWGQQIMVRLYKHMDISSAEQLMIEQLAEHGLESADLAPPLMQNARVRNPMAEDGAKSPQLDQSSRRTSLSQAPTMVGPEAKAVKGSEEVPEVHGVEDMPQTAQIDLDIRWTVLCDLFLVLISDSVYDARSRRLLERVASVLDITWIQICRFEKRVADQLEMEEAAKENWDESEHMEDRRKKGLKKKYMVMGLATVGGGLVIGLSAGLAAPLIGAGLAAGFATIGVSGTAGFLGGVGGVALITSAATAAGGTIAVRASNRRTGHVRTFEYRPLHNNKRLNLILTVSGWMTGKVDDVRLPFSTVDPIMGDIYSLLWEPEMLRSMGDTINILATEALTSTVQQVLGSTVLVALMASLQLPVVLTKLAYLIDNPWSVSLDRANAAGLILADSLMAAHLGQRPITLVGFSLGARLIFACLKELAAKNAYGIIQNVYLFGSPIVAKKDEWLRARSVISGRFVNGYASNDWILGYLFRATSGGIMRVAGLASVENVPGLENMDVTGLVNGHMAYRAAMPKLLRKLNWEVESDEFTEIEDPDPENHAKRQRELIKEIDEARKQAEEKASTTKRFGFFRRTKPAEKADWEKYNVADAKKSPQIGSTGPDSFEQNTNILFDIDAIKKELISEQIEVRELKSTQPPMQFTSIKDGTKQTEYLRLPPDIKPDEVAKIKLPPRPDEIDEDEPEAPVVRGAVARTFSTPAPQSQPQPQPQLQHATKDTKSSYNEDFEFQQPKELVSTLPPLKLTPQAGSVTSSRYSEQERPELKKHETDPTTVTTTTSMAGLALTSSAHGFTTHDMDLDHNAWADDGEVKMTFE